MINLVMYIYIYIYDSPQVLHWDVHLHSRPSTNPTSSSGLLGIRVSLGCYFLGKLHLGMGSKLGTPILGWLIPKID